MKMLVLIINNFVRKMDAHDLKYSISEQIASEKSQLQSPKT